MTKITLKGRVPSKKNSKRRVQRGRQIFMIPSKQHEDWHKDVMVQLELANVPSEQLGKIQNMVITFYAPDMRKGDMTNKTESVMDLLVDYGFLEDDNWFVVGDIRMRFGGLDRENPRAEIEVFYE